MKKRILRKLSSAFTPQSDISRTSAVILGAAFFVVVLAVWSLLSFTGIVTEQFLPTPVMTIQEGIELFTEEGFISDVGITTWRVLEGFIISAVIAVPLGMLIGTYAPLESFIEPLVSFVRYLPVTAFIPLFILWIGIGESEKIAVIIFGSFPQLLLMVAGDVRNVSHELIEVSYTLGTGKGSVLWKIIRPAATPHIVNSLRMVLGWAWTYVTVAEMIGASSGIGYMIIQSQRMLNVGRIFVGILTIGVIGLIFDCIFKWISKKAFPWF